MAVQIEQGDHLIGIVDGIDMSQLTFPTQTAVANVFAAQIPGSGVSQSYDSWLAPLSTLPSGQYYVETVVTLNSTYAAAATISAGVTSTGTNLINVPTDVIISSQLNQQSSINCNTGSSHLVTLGSNGSGQTSSVTHRAVISLQFGQTIAISAYVLVRVTDIANLTIASRALRL
jgi:hypothetical protein